MCKMYFINGAYDVKVGDVVQRYNEESSIGGKVCVVRQVEFDRHDLPLGIGITYNLIKENGLASKYFFYLGEGL